MVDRDKILHAAQKNPVAEHENEILRKALLVALAMVTVVIIVMSIVEMFVFHRLDFGKIFIVFLLGAIVDLMEGYGTNNVKEKIRGGILAAFSFVFLLLYVGGLFR